jgi:hypothetical protein
MIYLFYFYCAFSYLFEIGLCVINYKAHSNWYNLLLAPIFFPIKLGMFFAKSMENQ